VLMLEDPSLRVVVDDESGQTLLCGIGELHLEVVCDKLATLHKVPVETGQTYVAYRETLVESPSSSRRFVFDRMLGTKHMYAVMEYTLTSSGTGTPSTYSVSAETAKTLSPEELYSLEKGLEGALTRGPEGYPISGLDVVVTSVGKESGTSPGVLLACASALLDKEMRVSKQHLLLEPLMEVEVSAPVEFVGDVLSELSSRSAHIKEVVAEESFHCIMATVPLADMLGYATAIRSLTQGSGTFTMELEDYGIKSH
jgi:elongation factor G